MEVDPDETVLNSTQDSVQIIDSSQLSDTHDIQGNSPYPLKGLGKLMKEENNLSPVIPTYGINKFARRTSTPTPECGINNMVTCTNTLPNDGVDMDDTESQFSEVLISASQLVDASTFRIGGNPNFDHHQTIDNNRQENDSPMFDFSEDFALDTQTTCIEESQAESYVFAKHKEPSFKVPPPVAFTDKPFKPPVKKSIQTNIAIPMTRSMRSGNATNLDSQETILADSQVAINSSSQKVVTDYTQEHQDEDSMMNNTQDTEISVSLLPQTPISKPLPLEGILSSRYAASMDCDLDSSQATVVSDSKKKSVTWHDSVDQDADSTKSSQSSNDKIPPRIIKKHEQECKILEKIEKQLKKAEITLKSSDDRKKDVAIRILKPFKPLLDQVHKGQVREAETISSRLKEKIDKAEKKELLARFKLLKERQNLLVSIYKTVKVVTSNQRNQAAITQDSSNTPGKGQNSPATNTDQDINGPQASQKTQKTQPERPIPVPQTAAAAFKKEKTKEKLAEVASKDTTTKKSDLDIQPPPPKKCRTNTNTFISPVKVIPQGGDSTNNSNIKLKVLPAGQQQPGVKNSSLLREVSKTEEAMVTEILDNLDLQAHTPLPAPASTGTKVICIKTTGRDQLMKGSTLEQMLGGTENKQAHTSTIQMGIPVCSPPAALRAPSVADSSPELPVPAAKKAKRGMFVASSQTSVSDELPPSLSQYTVPWVPQAIGSRPSNQYPSLKTLVDTGSIKAGQNNLSLIDQGTTHYASLSANGLIQTQGGATFNTPSKWCVSLLNTRSSNAVRKATAYQRVLYNGVPLSELMYPPIRKDSIPGISHVPNMVTSSQDKGVHVPLKHPLTQQNLLAVPIKVPHEAKSFNANIQPQKQGGVPPKPSITDINLIIRNSKLVHLSGPCEYLPTEEVLPGFRWGSKNAFDSYIVPQSLVEEIDAW